MAERLENLADYVGPYVKEAVFGIKSSTRSLVEALKNGFSQVLEAAASYSQRREDYINQIWRIRSFALPRILALFPR